MAATKANVYDMVTTRISHGKSHGQELEQVHTTE